MAKRSGRVYGSERDEAIRQVADVDLIISVGSASSRLVTAKAESAIIRAYARGDDPTAAADAAIDEIAELVAYAMVAAKFQGMLRAYKRAPVDSLETIAAAISPAHKRAVKALQKRLGLTSDQVQTATRQTRQIARGVAAKMKRDANERLRETMSDIASKGLSKRDAEKLLRKTWSNIGLSPRNSHQLEAVFRTQSQLAYSAGRRQFEAQPEIQEILWGYKYATAGDSRVRLAHAVLDGVTLPKEDSFWRKNTPPNGWNCRCQAIAVYESRKVVAPPKYVIDESGKRITPGADKDFAFDPAALMAVS